MKKCTFLASALILTMPLAVFCADEVKTVIRTATGTNQYLVGFAHIAYGYEPQVTGVYWVTDFVFRNTSLVPADVTLHFFKSDGTPLTVPISGGTSTANYTFTVPANGSRDIATGSEGSLQTGWAAVEYTNAGIKGQAVFRHHVADLDQEAVVSMVSLTAPLCIIPIPGTNAFSMPLDNLSRVSSYAFANTTNQPVTMHAQFYDEGGVLLGEYSAALPPFGHTSFESNRDDIVPATTGKRGTMRLTGDGVIPMGFRFQNDAGHTFTTWLER